MSTPGIQMARDFEAERISLHLVKGLNVYIAPMCRSIQQLRGAEPPATDAEVRDAALQYVRKISGYRVPSDANKGVFDAAVDAVAKATQDLVSGLVVGSGSKPVTPVQRRLSR